MEGIGSHEMTVLVVLAPLVVAVLALPLVLMHGLIVDLFYVGLTGRSPAVSGFVQQAQALAKHR